MPMEFDAKEWCKQRVRNHCDDGPESKLIVDLMLVAYFEGMETAAKGLDSWRRSSTVGNAMAYEWGAEAIRKTIIAAKSDARKQ